MNTERTASSNLLINKSSSSTSKEPISINSPGSSNSPQASGGDELQSTCVSNLCNEMVSLSINLEQSDENGYDDTDIDIRGKTRGRKPHDDQYITTKLPASEDVLHGIRRIALINKNADFGSNFTTSSKASSLISPISNIGFDFIESESPISQQNFRDPSAIVPHNGTNSTQARFDESLISHSGFKFTESEIAASDQILRELDPPEIQINEPTRFYLQNQVLNLIKSPRESRLDVNELNLLLQNIQLNYGFNNLKKVLDQPNQYFHTPLSVAVCCNDDVSAKLLVDFGASLLVNSLLGNNTVFHVAALLPNPFATIKWLETLAVEQRNLENAITMENSINLTYEAIIKERNISMVV